MNNFKDPPVLPNAPPQFVEEISDIEFTFDYTSGSGIQEVPIPEVLDATDGELTMTVNNLLSYMSFDRASNKILIDSSKVTESSNTTIQVVVEDALGATSSLSFILRIDYTAPAEDPEKSDGEAEKEAETEESSNSTSGVAKTDLEVEQENQQFAESALSMFTFVPPSEETKEGSEAEEVEVREPVTLNMTSLGIEGELVLSFSEALYPLD